MPPNLKGERRMMREEGGADEADLEIVEDADAVEEGAVAGGEGSDLKKISAVSFQSSVLL